MRIAHLSLRNFRCFEKLELDFHPQCHVLIGKNGSGKTAILEALAVAAGCWFQGIGVTQARSIGHQDDVRLVGSRIGDAMTFEQQYPVQFVARGICNNERFIQEECEAAEKEIDVLRAEIAEFVELVRLQTRIDRIQLLSKSSISSRGDCVPNLPADCADRRA